LRQGDWGDRGEREIGRRGDWEMGGDGETGRWGEGGDRVIVEQSLMVLPIFQPQ